MRVVITGTQGQVDTSIDFLARADPDIELIRVGLPEVDLSQPGTLSAVIRNARPDVVISSAAYTAVDKAESEPDLAQSINGDSPGELARVAAELGVPLIHLSTDYVFSGDNKEAYEETDKPNPVSVYGRTKLLGEQQIQASTDNYVILRTAWVYSPYGNNFVKTMLRLGEIRNEVNVVADQHGCPTYAHEIARALLVIAKRIVVESDPSLRGTFHLTGQGETTWAGFARAIFRGSAARGGKEVNVNEIPSSAYPTPARRPSNSRLNGEKLFNIYGLRLDPWLVSLEDCLDHLTGSSREEIT